MDNQIVSRFFGTVNSTHLQKLFTLQSNNVMDK